MKVILITIVVLSLFALAPGPLSTQPPPVETQPPPVETQPPPVETQPPPVKTQPPPVETLPPPPIITEPPGTEPVITEPPSITEPVETPQNGATRQPTREPESEQRVIKLPAGGYGPPPPDRIKVASFIWKLVIALFILLCVIVAMKRNPYDN